MIPFTILILLLSGAIDGMVEGFEFDMRKSFERKFGVDPFGFFGSQSWKNRTLRPNIYNRLLGVFDFYHIADDLRKLLYLIAGGLIFKVAIENKWPIVITFILAYFFSGIAKKIGMNWIRK